MAKAMALGRLNTFDAFLSDQEPGTNGNDV